MISTADPPTWFKHATESRTAKPTSSTAHRLSAEILRKQTNPVPGFDLSLGVCKRRSEPVVVQGSEPCALKPEGPGLKPERLNHVQATPHPRNPELQDGLKDLQYARNPECDVPCIPSWSLHIGSGKLDGGDHMPMPNGSDCEAGCCGDTGTPGDHDSQADEAATSRKESGTPNKRGTSPGGDAEGGAPNKRGTDPESTAPKDEDES